MELDRSAKSEPSRRSRLINAPRGELIATPQSRHGLRRMDTVEALIRATGIAFRIGGARAFYAPGPDFVMVPPPQVYFEPINWHRTALHELGHATGHPSRLGRDLSGSFGTKSYAFEELVAEMNAAFCCASLGIVPTVRHADYIGSWLEVLREDNRAIVRAASQASKAADWLLSRVPILGPEFSATPETRKASPMAQSWRQIPVSGMVAL
jgi:antirestriction protein ArdC